MYIYYKYKKIHTHMFMEHQCRSLKSASESYRIRGTFKLLTHHHNFIF